MVHRNTLIRIIYDDTLLLMNEFCEVPEAVALVTHVSFDVKTTATTSPLAKLASA